MTVKRKPSVCQVSARKPKKGKPSTVNKNRAKKKGKSKGLGLPKNNGYVWKILTNVIRDADEDFKDRPATEFYTAHVNLLRGVVRSRSIKGYLEWCDKCSLTSINDQSVNNQPLALREVRWLRLLTLASKFQFENSPYDVLDAAVRAFNTYEALCTETNSRGVFQFFREEPRHKYLKYVLHPVLQHAEQFIHMVLGPKPDFIEFLDKTRHGPGATAHKRGDQVLPVYKNHPPLDCSPPAKELLVESISHDQRWYRSLCNYAKRQHRLSPVGRLYRSGWYPADLARACITDAPYSRVLFVPKNAKTLRTITSEPTGNIYGQLAVDGMVRKRLKLFGVDLNTQFKNQMLALLGSLTGQTDTLDLKGASDCIAKIWLIFFPPGWSKLLSTLRMEMGLLPDNSVVHFQKLSAMGNGYTFVIESLIFAALIYGVAIVEGYSWEEILPMTAVYGDDLVVPRRITAQLTWVLKDVGFLINEDKSFTYGPIRESCGTDYYNGELVSRPSLKSNPTHEWELIRDHNLIYLLSRDYGFRLNNTLELIRNWIPKRHYGPVDETRIIAWLFSETPACPDGYMVMPSWSCKEALYWQTPVFKVKTYIVGYRQLKQSRKSLDADVFDPLQYLSADSAKPAWHATNNGFKISSGVKSQSELYFDKAARVVRSSVTIIPEYLWPLPAQSLLE